MMEEEQMVKVERPADIVKFGTDSANMLKEVVKSAKLNVRIGTKEYLMFEGWQTVARFFGYTVGTVWCEQVKDSDGKITGYVARSAVKDKNGVEVSAAESSCGRDEKTWASRDDYALRSMAQTRASAKALRQVLSWVVTLAGFSGTPQEEMPDDGKTIDVTPSGVPQEYVCDGCGKAITKKVAEYSHKTYGKYLCFEDQKVVRENPAGKDKPEM